MTYDEFIQLIEKPEGLTSPKWSAYPLWFDEHDTLAEEIAQFSVIDDFMNDHGMDDFEADFHEHFPGFQILAACDMSKADDEPGFATDSYSEFFLAVDTSSDVDAVFLWAGSGEPEPFFDTFETFWASLEPWPIKK